MKKIAFVVQRYGLEVNGGAELQCRLLAEKMLSSYSVEVITTKAIDYMTWKDEYVHDEEVINGVLVHRFSIDEPRNVEKFNRLCATILQCNSSVEQEENWMRKQGPYSTELLEFLKSHKDDYNAFIFCTYLYATTYFGLKEVSEKAILIPDAHDEVPIYLGIFNSMFKLPRAIFYNSKEEKQFVERKFHIESIPNNDGLGGIGVEVPEDISAKRFLDKYDVDDFVLYIGRVDEHKGCKELFDYFREYKKRNGGNLKLLLMGKEVMKVPKDEDILSLGFVSEQDKYDGLAACKFLILPSQFESLSIVVLEAMKSQKPVLVHEKCEVVKGHCVRSNGGLYYRNYYEFEGCLNYLLEHEDIAVMMGINGQKYVEENYCWDTIEKGLSELIECIVGK